MSNRQPPAFLGRLMMVLDRIRDGLRHVAAEAADDLALGLTAITAWLWLDRVAAGMARLVERTKAGKLNPLRPRAASAAKPPRLPNEIGTPLPRGFAWLAGKLPDAVPIAAEIAALLADPELQPLLAQQPARFARLLRPFCRAMGVALPKILCAALPPAAAKPSAAPPAPRPILAPRSWPTPTSHRTQLLGTTRLVLEIA